MALTLQSGAELKLFVDSVAQDMPHDEYSSCDYFLQGAEGIFYCIRGGFYREEAKPVGQQSV